MGCILFGTQCHSFIFACLKLPELPVFPPAGGIPGETGSGLSFHGFFGVLINQVLHHRLPIDGGTHLSSK